MLIDIHDVGHGSCAVVTFPNGAKVMIDAGRRWDPYWAPSIEYYGQHIALLVGSNLDEDHVTDLPNLFRTTTIGRFFSNPTVNYQALWWLKRNGGMGTGVTAAYNFIRDRGTEVGPKPYLGDDVSVRTYWNRYAVDFLDTNNLSVATFIRFGRFTILFGGDLEEAGWLNLLKLSEFRADLAQVNVFVASHHGRENGCCEQLFWYFKPDIVVVSDYEHRHESQQTTAWYRARVKGIQDRTVPTNDLMPSPMRYVLTTRREGHLKIQVQTDGQYLVVPERLHSPSFAALSIFDQPYTNPLLPFSQPLR